MTHVTTPKKVVLISFLIVLSAGSASMVYAWLNTWPTNGPANGNVQTVAIDPVTPAILYAGTSGGGAFKSVDGGAH